MPKYRKYPPDPDRRWAVIVITALIAIAVVIERLT
jgi:hypothetical protein